VDGKQFYPPLPGVPELGPGASLEPLLQSLLSRPSLPPLLAICRPDPRKNIAALVEAFGGSTPLHGSHNLVLVMGCRSHDGQLGSQERQVFQQVTGWLDQPFLRGRVALPRQLRREQIPAVYRWAARRGGVFVNPALSEPFGLTLLEAAASGLPVVATDDGGPREILQRCRNGLLVDVSLAGALGQSLESSLGDPERWRRWSANGLEAVGRLFSWEAHVATYGAEARAAIGLGRRYQARVLRRGPRRAVAAQLGGVSPLPLGWFRLEAGIQ
jgi:sucrose-phosphate synthase